MCVRMFVKGAVLPSTWGKEREAAAAAVAAAAAAAPRWCLVDN